MVMNYAQHFFFFFFFFFFFYRCHSELMSKYNIGLKLRLQESLSEPEFHGDLVYNFTKIVGKFDFSVQFKLKTTVIR